MLYYNCLEDMKVIQFIKPTENILRESGAINLC